MKTKLIEIKPGTYVDPLNIVEIQTLLPDDEFGHPHRVVLSTCLCGRKTGFIIECDSRESALAKAEAIAKLVNEYNSEP